MLQSDKSNSDEMKKASPTRTQKKIARSSKRKRGGLLARKKRFKVRTVSAVVGVRGTEFVVAATEDSTNVLTVTGEVTLASAELPGFEVVLPKSSISRVSAVPLPVLLLCPPRNSNRLWNQEMLMALKKWNLVQQTLWKKCRRVKRDPPGKLKTWQQMTRGMYWNSWILWMRFRSWWTVRKMPSI